MPRERLDTTRTQGRWKDILARLGLDSAFLKNRHGPCPICGGTDRYRFDDKDGKGTFFCSGACGSGDGVDLVMKWKGVDFVGAKELILPLVETAAFEPPKAKVETPEEVKRQMTRVWKEARPLDGHDAASRYLGSRGIKRAAWPLSLRVTDELAYSDDDGTFRMLPAMLAKFVAADGKSGMLHRTYLGVKDGVVGKADVKSPRKMWKGKIPDGGAVRLGPAAECMGVAEGIETALSAEMVAGVPVWATTSAGALVKFEPPPECKHLIIFADSDASFTGQLAGYSLARRLTAARRIGVEVRLPMFHDVGEAADWNDWLVREREGAAA